MTEKKQCDLTKNNNIENNENAICVVHDKTIYLKVETINFSLINKKLPI